MTVASANTTSRKTYTGDAVTTSFATSPVIFFDTSDLDVYVVTTATGASTTLTENTHYTVTGGDGTTGTVNLAGGSSPYGAPSAAQTLVIVRDIPITQESDFANNDTSDAEVVEDALDRLTMIAQQLQTQVDRTFTLADSDVSGVSLAMPTPAASELIGFNSGATALTTYPAASIADTIIPTSFAETLLDDATAAEARTTLGVPSNAEAILDTIMDAAGDWIQASAADTPAKFPAYTSVAAHATTMDPWGARVALLTGGAVTFTDLADADYVGQRVLLLMNAAHVWTDGAVFDVQGGATYTTAAGDWVELVATAVDAFDVTIFPALGQPVSMQPITASLGADVALNNTSNYFSGPAVAQGTAGKWFVSGTITCEDTAGAATFYAKLWDGTTVVASAASTSPAANNAISITLSGFISAPAGNLRIDAQDITSTSGHLRYNETGNAKDCTITAIRIA